MSADLPEPCKLCQHLEQSKATAIPPLHAEGCPTGTLLESVDQKRASVGDGYPVRFDGREFYLPAKTNPQSTINPHHGYGYLSDIYPNSGSEECFDMIRKWVNRCNDEHGGSDCISTVPMKLPKRVIDVCPDDGTKVCVRLYESSGGEIGTYITLSHCWGNCPLLKTTSETLPAFLKEISWNIIPKTFQDAITVTRKLGVRYLWIDSLCIIQDSRSDWEEEAPKMSEMYGDSYLTIAACVAINAQSGFLCDRASIYLPRLLNVEGLRCRSEIDHINRPSREPMITRAWCFQERLVPRRILSYRVAEVTWECRSTHCCECGRAESYTGADRITYERALLKASLDEKRIYEYWYQKLLTEYMRLSITRETDRLAAVSALATQVQERLRMVGKNDVLIAGLWRSQLLESLSWRSWGKPIRIRGRRAEVGEASEEYRAPSWSWASIESRINFEKRMVANSTYSAMAEVLQGPETLRRLPEENALCVRGRIMQAETNIDFGLLTLRRRSRATGWMDSVVIGADISDDHAIPHYPIFIEGHEPIVSNPDGNGVNETAIFWPDCLLAIKVLDGSTCVERYTSSSEFDNGRANIWCLFLYRNGGTYGALVLTKSLRSSGCYYERLGFMELYDTHLMFHSVEGALATDYNMTHLDEQEIQII